MVFARVRAVEPRNHLVATWRVPRSGRVEPVRGLAALLSLGRLVFGAAFIARPKLLEEAWIGRQARLPGAQVLARAVGARDLTLGLGALQAVARHDGSARPWLAAAAICDSVDFGATYGTAHPASRTQWRAGDRERVLALIAAAAAASGSKPQT